MLCIRKKIFTFVKVKKIDRFDLKNVVNRKKSRLTDFSFRDFLIENASCPPSIIVVDFLAKISSNEIFFLNNRLAWSESFERDESGF